MTFEELKDEVLENLIDTPAVVQARAGALVNRAIRTIQRRHDFKINEELLEFTTAPTIRELGAVPSDFRKFRAPPYYLTFNDTHKEISIAASRRVLTSSFTNYAEGPPAYIYVEGSNFEVWPLSDTNSDWANGEYRVKIPVWNYLAALVADGDTNWFTLNAEDWIVAQATAKGFLMDWNEERAAVWAQVAAGEYADVVRSDKHLRLSGMDTLVIHHEGARPLLAR